MKLKLRTVSIALLGTALLAAPAFLSITHRRPLDDLSVSDVSRSFVPSNRGKVRNLYDRWVQKHERAGGDRNVAIALGPAKGMSEPGINAHGVAHLDLIGGGISVRVNGLPKDQAWDVWLLDDHGGSILVDPGDATKRLGRLSEKEGTASLQVNLGAEALEDFEVDAVFVAAAGQTPDQPAALYGMPNTFQRLYTKARLNRMGEYFAELGIPRSPIAASVESFLELPDAQAAGTVVDPDVLLDPMVAFGAQVFMNETFDGNGRTCATCHPPENNFTIDKKFISHLPPSDPLFVAENDPDLSELEVPVLLHQLGLIVENVDGFDNPGVLRSVPHLLGLSTSLQPATCVDPAGCAFLLPQGPVIYPFGAATSPIDISISEASGFDPIVPAGPDTPEVSFPLERTGWGGDGAPGSGTLREFAIGAVFQHFTKSLDRVPGVDFRLPTAAELDAMEVFQLSLGRSEELDLDNLTFRNPTVQLGKEIFRRVDTAGGTLQAGKCEICHANAGANSTPEVFGELVSRFGLPRNLDGNQSFETGLSDVAIDPAETIAPGVAPRDGGFGLRSNAPGDCISGQFDVSGPFPTFTPTPGMEPGGFGGHSVAPLIPFSGLCLESFRSQRLVEAADTAPFFHNNSAATIEDAVAFYSTDAFNKQPQVELFVAFSDSGRIAIDLTDQSNKAIAKFLRVINALENLRESKEFDAASIDAGGNNPANQLVKRSNDELKDARRVLQEVNLHPAAVALITTSMALNDSARLLPWHSQARETLVNTAVDLMTAARKLMVNEPS